MTKLLCIIIWEFFTPALADSFPVESEWKSPYQSFGDCTEHASYNWHYRHFYSFFLQFSGKV